MKGGISKKLAVRIPYKDGKTEFIPMLTGEFYKFITRFNKSSHIDHFKVEKVQKTSFRFHDNSCAGKQTGSQLIN